MIGHASALQPGMCLLVLVCVFLVGGAEGEQQRS